ncbi:hypothetical protein BAU15_05765 [Enterococcus sp. JM4C]|uniref:L,D-transpeptidase family protein n=1 Tax=Candidatus Enterococcus huntleyi TaxID=1857217 RepID=UPI001379FF20|nr:L,D-transpeptidase family protein [Enterococcus sp. JM4C]KAF1295256.1 hypothetical protein BAU15_05765 [Enterococcus sp. JM4C]
MTKGRTRARQKRSASKIVLFVILGIVILLAGGYTYRSIYYTKHFLPKTEVNSVDISDLTIDEAKNALQKEYSSKVFTIQEEGKTWHEVKKSELGVSPNFTKELEILRQKQNPWGWAISYVSAAEKETLSSLDVDQEKLTASIATIKNNLVKLNESRTKSEDAKVIRTESGFSIQKETVGNSINIDEAIASITQTATEGKETIDLLDFRVKPTVTADDENLKKEIEKANKIAQVKATYTINGASFVIPTATIMEWIETKDSDISLNNEKLTAYVNELAAMYNTSSNPTKFTSTRRGEVSVPAGSYSWTIQVDQEAAALRDSIMAGEDFTRSPIVQGSTTADHALVGSTYIEVDLQNQHMWFYKDGALVLETDVVTGKPSSPTPAGVFYVWNHEQNATLRGLNDDGTKYASPVKYWMPIDWTGVGIHDSDWQPQYGGELWKTVGSHGCVNTPPGVMKQLYGAVENGTPVLVF